MKLIVSVDSFLLINRSKPIVLFLALKDHQSSPHHFKVVLSFFCLSSCFSGILINLLAI